MKPELPQIQSALNRARRRWLNAAAINAGGRWASLPAGLAALVGLVLVVLGVRELAVLLLVSGLGLVGILASVVLTRAAFARPGRQGAPDWSLSLDRALGLQDALPTLLETPGPFAATLQARVVAALDPLREKQAAPQRHFVPLAVALLLCLLPLAGLAPDALPQDAANRQGPATQTAGTQPGQPAGANPGDNAPAGDEPGDGPGQSTAKGRDGQSGKPQPKPDGSAGEAPENKPKPDPFARPPKDSPANPGDRKGTPLPAEPPPHNPDAGSKDNPITPDAGKGETREEVRSRWLYNPDGQRQQGAQPNLPNRDNAGEMHIPRGKVTTTERQRLEELFNKLYR